jgi:hypothetical protein
MEPGERSCTQASRVGVVAAPMSTSMVKSVTPAAFVLYAPSS